MPQRSGKKTSYLRCYFFSGRVDCASKNHALPGNSASSQLAARYTSARWCPEIRTKSCRVGVQTRPYQITALRPSSGHAFAVNDEGGGGDLFVGARRLSTTKHMSLFQQPASRSSLARAPRSKLPLERFRSSVYANPCFFSELGKRLPPRKVLCFSSKSLSRAR